MLSRHSCLRLNFARQLWYMWNRTQHPSLGSSAARSSIHRDQPGWSERSCVFYTVQETFWVSRLTRLLTDSCWHFWGWTLLSTCFSRWWRWLFYISKITRQTIINCCDGIGNQSCIGASSVRGTFVEPASKGFFGAFRVCAVSTFLRETKNCVSFDDHCS